MRVLFVHQNFPAQFGHLAAALVQRHGYECTFVSETGAGKVEGVEKIQYKAQAGAAQRAHYSARTFENGVCHAAGVYEALKPQREHLQPDLIVGHSGFGSTLFLPELFPDVPIINLFNTITIPEGQTWDFGRSFRFKRSTSCAAGRVTP